MMRQMCPAKEIQQPKHQHHAVEKAQNRKIVPITGKRDPVNILVEEHTNAVVNQGTGDERNPERKPQQQYELHSRQGHQTPVSQQRGASAAKKLLREFRENLRHQDRTGVCTLHAQIFSD